MTLFFTNIACLFPELIFFLNYKNPKIKLRPSITLRRGKKIVSMLIVLSKKYTTVTTGIGTLIARVDEPKCTDIRFWSKLFFFSPRKQNRNQTKIIEVPIPTLISCFEGQITSGNLQRTDDFRAQKQDLPTALWTFFGIRVPMLRWVKDGFFKNFFYKDISRLIQTQTVRLPCKKKKFKNFGMFYY